MTCESHTIPIRRRLYLLHLASSACLLYFYNNNLFARSLVRPCTLDWRTATISNFHPSHTSHTWLGLEEHRPAEWTTLSFLPFISPHHTSLVVRKKERKKPNSNQDLGFPFHAFIHSERTNWGVYIFGSGGPKTSNIIFGLLSPSFLPSIPPQIEK